MLKNIKLSPFFLILYFLFLLLVWHFSLVWIGPFSIGTTGYYLSRLLWIYPTIVSFLAIVFSSLYLLDRFHVVGKIVYLLFIFSAIIRTLDWNVVYFYGNHIDYLFWQNAFYGESVAMIFNKITMITIVILFLSILGFYFFSRVAKNHLQENNDLNRSKFIYFMKHIFLSLVVVFAIAKIFDLTIVKTLFIKPIASTVYMRNLPERHFLQSVRYFFKTAQAEKIVLTEKHIKKLRKVGLKLHSTSKNNFPLYKNSIFVDGPPEKALYKPSTPNIIFIMVESFSSFFIEDPRVTDLGVVDNFLDFKSKSYYFDNIYNASLPTLQGLIATFASSLHLYRTSMAFKRASISEINTHFHDRGDPLTTRYPFVSALLDTLNYHSVQMQGGTATFTSKEHIFRLHGYDEFHSTYTDAVMPNKKYPVREWGASDVDTFTYINNWLDNYDNEKPFVMSMTTVDIHHPYNSVLKKSGVDNNLLNCVYSTDVGFGLFWDHFQKSKYRDNTIIVVAADHPIFPNAEYLDIRKTNAHYYDKIPMMIYWSGFKDKLGSRDHTIGTNLDVMPTVLEMMGQDMANSFLGLSLLSERKKYPFLLGRINLQKMFNKKSSLSWSDSDHERFIGFLKYLSSSNSIYPLDLHRKNTYLRAKILK